MKRQGSFRFTPQRKKTVSRQCPEILNVNPDLRALSCVCQQLPPTPVLGSSQQVIRKISSTYAELGIGQFESPNAAYAGSSTRSTRRRRQPDSDPDRDVRTLNVFSALLT